LRKKRFSCACMRANKMTLTPCDIAAAAVVGSLAPRPLLCACAARALSAPAARPSDRHRSTGARRSLFCEHHLAVCVASAAAVVGIPQGQNAAAFTFAPSRRPKRPLCRPLLRRAPADSGTGWRAHTLPCSIHARGIPLPSRFTRLPADARPHRRPRHRRARVPKVQAAARGTAFSLALFVCFLTRVLTLTPRSSDSCCIAVLQVSLSCTAFVQRSVAALTPSLPPQGHSAPALDLFVFAPAAFGLAHAHHYFSK
jgi:hypothetical protein